MTISSRPPSGSAVSASSTSRVSGRASFRMPPLLLLGASMLLVRPGVAAAAATSSAGVDSPAAIQRCEAHIRTLAEAVRAYRESHGALPPSLSSLYPRYLHNRAVLHCPSDPTAGTVQDPVPPGWVQDPGLPDSYLYEMNSSPAPAGAAFYLAGPGQAPTTWRGWKTAQMRDFGGWVPAIRCWHHFTPNHMIILNGTLNGHVYESGSNWEFSPPVVSGVADRLERDLQGGSAAFRSRWVPLQIEQYFGALPANQGPLPQALQTRLTALARQIAAGRDGLYSRSAGLMMAGDVAAAAGNATIAKQEFNEAIRLSPGAAADANMALGAMYFGYNKDAEAVPYLEKALRSRPDSLDGLVWLYRAEDHTKQDREFASFLEPLIPQVHDVQMKQTYQFLLAQVYLQLGEKQKAQDLAAAAQAEGNAGGQAGAGADRDPGAALVGKMAPDFTVKTTDGKTIRLSDYRGKVVFVNYWASWCPPCREEAPHMEALYRKYSDRGFVVLGLDDEGSAGLPFAHKMFTYPVSVTAGGVEHTYDIQGIPTTFAVDRSGKIVYRWVGFGPELEPEFVKQIEALLPGPPATAPPARSGVAPAAPAATAPDAAAGAAAAGAH